MATKPGVHVPPTAPEPGNRRAREVLGKALEMLGIVLVIQCAFALCLIRAIQLLAPRQMSFGEVGSSQVVKAVVAKKPGAFHVITFPSASAALHAFDQCQI